MPLPTRLPTRFELTALLASLTALTALALDTVLPALGQISRELAITDATTIQYVVILFIFGMVFGEIVFGPLSDSIGRKNAILVGLAIFLSGSFIAAFASTIEMMLAGRIIQGIGVAGAKIGSRAIIRDLFQGPAMAKILSVIFAILVLVPMLAPIMGQWVMAWYGWRAIFILLLAWAAIATLWLTTRLAETLPPSRRIPVSFKTLATNTMLILQHPKIMAYTLCAGLIFGAQLLFIALAHALFVDLYQTGSAFPYYFALLGLATGLGAFVNSRMVYRFGLFNITLTALINIAASGLMLAAIGQAYQHTPPFIWFMVTAMLVFLSIGVVIGNINAMAMQSMGRVAGLGSSAIASLSSLIAVVFSAICGSLYDNSTLPLAVAVFLAASFSIFLLILVEKKIARPI